MAYEVTLIPGDGIGPEITQAMQRVVAAAGVEIAWHTVEAGEHVMASCGTPLPQSVIDSIKETKIAIKGPVTTPIGTGFRSINVSLRKELDLYMNLRPALSIPGTGARYDGVDIVIVRENTEDLYAGIECPLGSEEASELISWSAERGLGTIRPDSGISIKPISVTGSKRIVRAAFEYAIEHGRHLVTAVHKANIMKDSDGLFLEVAREIAREYEGRVDFNDKIVDATCMELVLHPEHFDVLVLPNLYGDIVSDLAAGLIGGLGMAPGANIGDECAVFEAVHGSAPQIAGQDVANPTALLLSAVEMLYRLGEAEAGTAIRAAIVDVIEDGANVTRDIAWSRDGEGATYVGTKAFTDAVISALG